MKNYIMYTFPEPKLHTNFMMIVYNFNNILLEFEKQLKFTLKKEGEWKPYLNFPF